MRDHSTRLVHVSNGAKVWGQLHTYCDLPFSDKGGYQGWDHHKNEFAIVLYMQPTKQPATCIRCVAWAFKVGGHGVSP